MSLLTTVPSYWFAMCDCNTRINTANCVSRYSQHGVQNLPHVTVTLRDTSSDQPRVAQQVKEFAASQIPQYNPIKKTPRNLRPVPRCP